MVKCTKGQVRRLKTALRWNGDPQRRQRIQMVLLRQPAIAEAMGVSLSTVNRAHMAYDGGGLQALKSKPSGGRKRENMTLAEERVLLARFAKAAGAGEMGRRVTRRIHAALRCAIKASSPLSLSLRGWRSLRARRLRSPPPL